MKTRDFKEMLKRDPYLKAIFDMCVFQKYFKGVYLFNFLFILIERFKKDNFIVGNTNERYIKVNTLKYS